MRSRRAFTLLELLVVISIVGIVGSLALVAINGARESARRTVCQNNIRQLGLAVQSHLVTHGHFPSGGWTFHWIGLSDRGFGREQPGSWIYNLLPELEYSAMRTNSPSSVDLLSGNVSKFHSFSTLDIPVVHCPSKIPRGNKRNDDTTMIFGALQYCAKSDYAMNAGQTNLWVFWRGPNSLEEGDSPSFEWPNRDGRGIAVPRQLRYARDVLDGFSQTLCIGEKQIFSRSLNDRGDNQPPWTGFGFDTCRFVSFPMNNDNRNGLGNVFGGPHPSVCMFGFADGSVQGLSIHTELSVFESLGIIDDGARESTGE